MPCIFQISNMDTLRITYHADFHTIIMYMTICGGNSVDKNWVFVLQERTEIWLLFILEVHVEGYLRNQIYHPYHFHTYSP